MSKHKLKIGVFGAGHLGRIHIRLILELSDLYEFVGFYDPSDESAEKVLSEFKVSRWNDMQELINACDCVDVVAPTLYHFDIASRAIRSSKHVFIEKPLAETTEQAKTLLDLSREAGVIVQVGHVERFNPAFRAAEPLIVKPMFFEIHRLAQYNPRGTDVSVILDLMIHDLDIVLSCVNSTIRRISASGVSVVSKTPDITSVRIEFDNGCVANLTASRMSLNNMRKTRIFQKTGYLVIDYLNQSVDQIMITPRDQEAPGFFSFQLNDDVNFSALKPEIIKSNAIQEELRSFYNSIVYHQPVIVSIDDAYRALDVAYQIIDKLKSAHLSVFDNN
ncbi:Gfo/Idh/MocA family oxidoreductase [Fluviicola sp.]|jgi:predicted dehydrogenase|uniref:Gfo/Idh/MocA family protein n=1 Tax=Fluviicola sp. TaxID=1917219 RepID=UPI00282E9A3E|nr:Gfo/Idh/MocA family oxidoreductase [Fluviicola sp.]MDR0801828.1 Gfo/Idh/MocA family oxidoreductase [Fluviicola sp.]